jgi:hypothetical protein
VSLLEEKIIYENMEYQTNYHKKLILIGRDQGRKLNDLVFEKIIELINKNKSYMLGPEKTSTARFISKHYMDVYEILKEVIKKENIEF